VRHHVRVQLPVRRTLDLERIDQQLDELAVVATIGKNLADATLQVLSDRALAQRLSAQARRLVEGRYDWSKITPAYLRLLSTARKARRATPRG